MVHSKIHFFADEIVDSELTAAAQEWDFDSVIGTKTSSQCSVAVQQANKMLDSFRNIKNNKMENIIMHS